jgi:hypothetical protein
MSEEVDMINEQNESAMNHWQQVIMERDEIVNKRSETLEQ